jgi:hypothetical protein
VFADVDPAPIWDGDFTIKGDALPEPPKAYHLTSADKLPADAVDGSLAVVEYGEPITKTVGATAIPVGEPVERIYFNTNLSVEEVNSYLSQLTYVNAGFEYPINVIFASGYNFLIAAKISEYNYFLAHNTEPNMYDNVVTLYTSLNLSGWKGYPCSIMVPDEDGTETDMQVSEIKFGSLDMPNDASLTSLYGIPVGAENEKIKNVLSITPVSQISYSKAIYSRENGEWVNKGEI